LRATKRGLTFHKRAPPSALTICFSHFAADLLSAGYRRAGKSLKKNKEVLLKRAKALKASLRDALLGGRSGGRGGGRLTARGPRLRPRWQ
jgi:hypothetical protein